MCCSEPPRSWFSSHFLSIHFRLPKAHLLDSKNKKWAAVENIRPAEALLKYTSIVDARRTSLTVQLERFGSKLAGTRLTSQLLQDFLERTILSGEGKSSRRYRKACGEVLG